MFDAVLNRHSRAPRRWGRGAVATILLHTIALGGFAWASLRGASSKGNNATEVTFFAAPPAPPPPPPAPVGGGGKTAPKTEKPKVTKKPDTVVEPKKTQKEPEPEPPKEAPKPGGEQGGQAGGVQGGQVGGQVGGQLGGQLDGQVGGQLGGGGRANAVLPFGAGMERPRMLSGTKEVVWTKEAKAAGASGTAILKCIITTEGAITGCRVIKGVAHMDQAILAMVSGWRYTPVMFQGRAVAVDYTFTIPLRSAD